jgi:hypothetical protein
LNESLSLLRRRRGRRVMEQCIGVCLSKEDGTELQEEGTLEGFGEEVSQHVVGGTMVNVNGMTFGVISDEKIMDVDMARALTGGSVSILLHLDGTFVVLVKGGNGAVKRRAWVGGRGYARRNPERKGSWSMGNGRIW